MDVRRGRFAWNEIAKRVVGDLIGLQVLPQPFPFGAVRVERDIHAVAMIEAQGSMQGRLS